ncbi:MAG TPA: DUF348 domain-containing protein [Chloroflexi bacterium]|nr:DUF348 domain-containing protein [Chloroflexota bacterium]
MNYIQIPRGLKVLVALIFIFGAMAAGYQNSMTPITLVVDGQEYALHTHQKTLGAFLMDIGLTLHPKDIIYPRRMDTPLQSNMHVDVQRAQLVHINADGHHASHYTHSGSIDLILQEARLSVNPYDEIRVEGQIHPLDAGLDDLKPAQITIRRATPFTLHDGENTSTHHSIANTVGEALRHAGLTLYLADGVEPALGERLSAGMHIHVNRSKPVTVQVDGRTMRARTHREHVGEVLADLGVILTGQDYAEPPLDDELGEQTSIRVVRVSERFLIEQEPIPFEILWQPDHDLEIDHERVMQEGARGVRERRIRVRYEDGHEIAREVDSQYVAVPPTNKVFGYGTKVVVRTLDTPSGPVEYWRKLRALATSYSAGTAGTPRSSPWYGRTATGMQMRHGIVAVDPRVIKLHSHVYVPGYGVGIAGDTGGAIKGRRIDLGYDDDNLVLWYRWVDVYLLTPVPDQIRYVLD